MLQINLKMLQLAMFLKLFSANNFFKTLVGKEIIQEVQSLRNKWITQ